MGDDAADRPVVGLGSAQLGDAAIGEVAGGDIYHGARADSLVELLRYQIDKDSQYRLLDLKVREVRQEEIDRQSAALRAELRATRHILLLVLLLLVVELVIIGYLAASAAWPYHPQPAADPFGTKTVPTWKSPHYERQENTAMPWIEKPTASLTYSLIDETGSPSTFSLDVPQTTPADVALTAAAALRPLIEACTDCEVVAYSLAYNSRNTTPAAAGAGSRVERKGVFQFLTAAGKIATYQLPGIIDAAVLPDGRIDDDNLAIAAFAGAIIAIDALFTDSNGVGLDALYAAYERYSRTTKMQLPVSRRPD